MDSANEAKSDQQTKIVVLENETERLRQQLAEAKEQAEREIIAVRLSNSRSSRENSSENDISKKEYNSLYDKYKKNKDKNNELHEWIE